jgi:adenine-specific DNA-methyltransferase
MLLNKYEFKEIEDIVSLRYIPRFRFIGSKYNLLPFICKVLKEEQFDGVSFFDVFAGSAVVGRFFKKKFLIISNDNLYFSYILQRSLITINDYPAFSGLRLKNLSDNPQKRICQILEYLNNIEGVKGFVYRHYTPASKDIDGIERKYFSIKNGAKIDSIRLKIQDWFENGYISDDEYFYLITSLLFAVQKVANISGTYGAFNKWWDPRSYKPITLKYIEIIPSKFKHMAYNEDIFNLIEKVSCDIAYIDPPYNSRQYIDNYHVLETIAKYDNPEIEGKTGLRKDRYKQKSPFCDEQRAQNAFRELLMKLKSKYVLLSYNNEGLLTKSQITQILEESGFIKVKCYEIPYRKFKSHINSSGNRVIEYLFTGVKITKNDKVN